MKTICLLIAAIGIACSMTSAAAQEGSGTGRVTMSSFNFLMTRADVTTALKGWRIVTSNDTLIRAVPGATITFTASDIRYEEVVVVFAGGRVVSFQLTSPILFANRAPLIKDYFEVVWNSAGWTLPRVGWEVMVGLMKQAESGKTVELGRVNASPDKTIVARLRSAGGGYLGEITVIKDRD